MPLCDDRIEALVDAAAGTLDVAQRATLDAHLATCPGCREELAVLREVEDELRETSSPPEDLHLSGFAFRTAERAETFRDRSLRGLWWSLTRGPRLALGLSSAALAVAVVLLFVPGAAHVTPAPVAPIAATTDESFEGEEFTLDEFAFEDEAANDATPTLSLDSAFDSLTGDELDTLDALLDEAIEQA